MSDVRRLIYRAGPEAIRRLRAGDVSLDDFGAFIAPASGPKWLVLAGVDRALMRAGFFAPPSGETSPRRLLVGASAGAWRIAALTSRDPRAAHQALQDGYIGQVLPRGMTTDELTALYREMLGRIFKPAEIDHALHRSGHDLGIFTARLGSAAARSRYGHAAILVAAGLLSPATPRAVETFFRRTLFTTRPELLQDRFRGAVVPMNAENFFDAVFASGNMPYYFRGVRDPAGAPSGVYFDGGLSDYHFRQPGFAPGRLVLFPHYLNRVVPGWFDKKFPRRKPSPEASANLLVLHPSPSFMERLPDGRLPDRDEFFRFVDAPEERMRRWQEAAKLSDELGEEFLDDLSAGRIADLVEPI